MASCLPVECKSETLSYADKLLRFDLRQVRAQTATLRGFTVMSSVGMSSPCALRLSI